MRGGSLRADLTTHQIRSRESRRPGGDPSVGCGNGARGPGGCGGAGDGRLRRGARGRSARRPGADLPGLHRRRSRAARRDVHRLLDARPVRGHGPAEASVRRLRGRGSGRVDAGGGRQPPPRAARHPTQTAVWTWFPPDQTARFVARRIANEIAIHRVDAQVARGSQKPVDAELAADGIEEIFVLLQHPQRDDLFSPTHHTLHLHGTDFEPSEWFVDFGPDGLTMTPRAREGRARAEGPGERPRDGALPAAGARPGGPVRRRRRARRVPRRLHLLIERGLTRSRRGDPWRTCRRRAARASARPDR